MKTYKEHKEELEKKYNMQDNPKKDKLYSFAYDFGHANGYLEVEGYYIDLLELVR